MLLKVIEENEDTGWVHYDLHSKTTVLFFLTILNINLRIFFQQINELIKNTPCDLLYFYGCPTHLNKNSALYLYVLYSG